ncbi:DUF4340 domain-containing protein [Patescibacteria group bacterium]|nr:DUF4340 domain-containing protein [Patescibacteria group bacterium]
MHKRYITTIAVVLAFFALLAFVFFFEKDKKSKEDIEVEKEELQEIPVLGFAEDDVSRLVIQNANGTFTLTKDGESWKLAEDEAYDVNPLEVSSLIKYANNLVARSTFQAENKEEYGLTEPSIKATFDLTYDKQITLDFGDPTPDEANIYVMSSESNDVLVVPVILFTQYSAVTKDSFKRTKEEGEVQTE